MKLLHSNIWWSNKVEFLNKIFIYSKGLNLYRKGILCVDNIWDNEQQNVMTWDRAQENLTLRLRRRATGINWKTRFIDNGVIYWLSTQIPPILANGLDSTWMEGRVRSLSFNLLPTFDPSACNSINCPYHSQCSASRLALTSIALENGKTLLEECLVSSMRLRLFILVEVLNRKTKMRK